MKLLTTLAKIPEGHEPGHDLKSAAPSKVEHLLPHHRGFFKENPHGLARERANPAATRALHDYIKVDGTAHKELNAHLRGHGSHVNPHPEMHRELRKLTINPLSHEQHLYRGISGLSGIHKLKKGDTFVDHGYSSTSRNPDVAARMHRKTIEEKPSKGSSKSRGTTLVAHIHAVPGTRGHEVGLDDRSHHPHIPQSAADTRKDEHEVILHHGTKFKVLGHSKASHRVRDPETGRHTIHKYHVVHLQTVPDSH